MDKKNKIKENIKKVDLVKKETVFKKKKDKRNIIWNSFC